MMESKALKLVSYNLISDHPQFNSLGHDHDGSDLIRKRKLKRFYSIGTKQGLISTRQSLLLSGLDIDEPAIKFGLYTTQYGYLHPMPSELFPDMEQNKVKDKNEIYQTSWASEQINPFLITLSLSNNLLGVLSQELGLQGDCASFLRGNIGLLSAFNEAELLLNSGFIDYALVVASGMGSMVCDPPSGISEEFVEFGITFILASGEKQTQKDYPSIDISSLYRMYREGNYSAETIDFIKDIVERMASYALTESF
ncbi:hypothetical protein [Xenorhabdus bovienii]|uniref:Beta-ketoacyl synthase N-terminal domain-containing protein n=2 Tax=Xenorhabdus bovienii TaxID=40576 RepID=A0A077QCB4_XENBV|nr:hypothetical protein [Xenorhabdus bovienii]MDE9454317.1 hypothetical protein [Xenorhabdus bovienii]CDH33817.1 conserved hypothetical protein [Xenorhabdus bovienii str. Intermedium]